MEKVVALVGGQYGSEGKGAVAAHLANRFDVHVRVGGPNAGHTYRDPVSGQMFVSQALPCGWVNRNATLVIGRGAVVDFDQLAREVANVEKVDPTIRDRLMVDENAWPITRWDQNYGSDGGGVAGDAHERIGSTGKGVGSARIGRLLRDPDVLARVRHQRTARAYGDAAGLGRVRYCDTVDYLNRHTSSVFLEGTQGSGLSLTHGPWPFVTTEDTNAAGLLSAVGLPPSSLAYTILCCRTYPIRVAGNSGPLPNEITWGDLSRWTGGYVKEERTTVTKKVRRVAEWDGAVVNRAIMLNRPVKIALMFADYVDPGLAGTRDPYAIWRSEPLRRWLLHNAPGHVSLFGTGPDSMVAMEDLP